MDDDKPTLERSGTFPTKYSDACEARIAAFRPVLNYETVLIMWSTQDEAWKRSAGVRRALIAAMFCDVASP
jgi:hypothetical protein